MLAVGFCIHFHRLLGEISLMTIRVGTIFDYSSTSLDVITLTVFSPIVFGSILGLYSIQPLGTSAPGSGMGFRLNQSLVGHSHSSVPPLSQHIP